MFCWNIYPMKCVKTLIKFIMYLKHTLKNILMHVTTKPIWFQRFALNGVLLQTNVPCERAELRAKKKLSYKALNCWIIKESSNSLNLASNRPDLSKWLLYFPLLSVKPCCYPHSRPLPTLNSLFITLYTCTFPVITLDWKKNQWKIKLQINHLPGLYR